MRTADGRWLWLQHLGHVDRDENGAARALHAVLIDVTESRRREQAAELLAAAGRVLAGPGSVEERLAAAVELAAGQLAGWAAVWLRGDDERYHPVAAAPGAVAGRVLALTPVRVPVEFEAAFRTGQAFAVPAVTEAMRREATADDAQYAALTELGGRHWLAAPLSAGGELVGLLTVATDERPYDDDDATLAADLGQRLAVMVAGERLAAQRRALHEITVALSVAGTVAEAAAAVTGGLRRALGASVVSVAVMGADGLLHAVDMAGYPEDERRAKYAARRLSDPFPLTDAARGRHPIWLHDRASLIGRYPAVVPDLQAHTQAVAALPLLVGDRLVGALAVTFGTPRQFAADERALLLTVAGQIAAAFERAALADAGREMAETLQRSLLPADLPDVERLAVTARYLPAVQGTAAGGDWYDVLPVAGGNVAVMVGDVVGNGAAAAAVMGQLRSALASALLAGCSPARALEVLDRFARLITGARMSTVLCLVLEPDTGRLTYSSAGHPPPLLDRGDGDHHDAALASYLDGGLGPALGLPPSGQRPEAVSTLATGTTLLLYTDGLVERRGTTLDEGLGRLAAAVTARRSAPLPALVEGVLDELLDDDGAPDDVAVVAVRPLPAWLRLDVPAEPDRLPQLRRTVRRWAAEASLPPDAIEDLLLVIGEATGNAVEHAYREMDVPGRVIVELQPADAGAVLASVTDTGSWRPPPGDPGFRGRGLHIISALARDVELSAGPTGTTLRFVFASSATAEAAVSPLRTADGRRPVAPATDERPAILEVTDAQGPRCVAIIGDLDLAGATGIREHLRAELADHRPITLDLTRLGHVTSIGAGLLLEVADPARAHGDLDVVLPATGPARRLLDLTGLASALQPAPGSSPH